MITWQDVQLFNKLSGGVIGQTEPSVERCKGAEYQQVVMCSDYGFAGCLAVSSPAAAVAVSRARTYASR